MEKVSVADRVKNFLREREKTPYCDDCIKKQLGLARRQQAQSVTSALAGTSGFIRSKGLCFDCGKDKFGTRFEP